MVNQMQPLKGYNLTSESSRFNFRHRTDMPQWMIEVEKLENEYGTLNALKMNDPRLLRIRKLQREEAEKKDTRRVREKVEAIEGRRAKSKS